MEKRGIKYKLGNISELVAFIKEHAPEHLNIQVKELTEYFEDNCVDRELCSEDEIMDMGCTIELIEGDHNQQAWRHPEGAGLSFRDHDCYKNVKQSKVMWGNWWVFTMPVEKA